MQNRRPIEIETNNTPVRRPRYAHRLLTGAALTALLVVPGITLGFAAFEQPADAVVEPSAVGESAGLAAADELKQQAIGALKSGDFSATQKLIDEALRLRPDDSTLRQMNQWVSSFQEKQESFKAERHKAFERQVKDIKLLQDNGYRSYAVSAAAGAYLLADDKEEFRKQPWVQELIDESRTLGEAYEEKGEWLRAMRVWGDLASIEELNPEWKAKLKGATRRVRLLAVYTPEILEELRDSTQAERDAVDKLLADDRATEKAAAGDTQDDPTAEDGEASDAVAEAPATQPADPSAALDDSFRTDWHDAVAGVTIDMLRDALQDAQRFYVRPVEFQDMLLGGIDAALALATTPGLERAFPTLADAKAKARYIELLEAQYKAINEADAGSIDARRLVDLLNTLRMVNNQTVKVQEEVIVSEFADGALQTLDPFSNMIWPSQLAEFTKGTQGEFVGVGIQIRAEDNGDLRVVSPLPDSPAYEAGVQPNDVITHIDGKSAKGITDVQAVKSITGKPNTDVTLTIKSVDGAVKDYTLTRRQINVVSVKGWKQLPGGKWDYFVDPEEKIAYLRLTNFQKTTSEELTAAVNQMKDQGARAVILDLRYNPGGLLQSAVEVSDTFLGDGVVVSTKGDRVPDIIPPSVHRAHEEKTDVDLPMVCLVNEYSASASEIVSGALKDHDRALIVGTRTFGKGSVQMLYRLGNGRGDPEALLKLTTAHYYLPSGKNIHKEEFDTDWGVNPDVSVDMTPEQMRDAISARQSLDVLREDGSVATVKVEEDGEPVQAEDALLDTDAQLSAALLLLRMQLAGETVM